MKIPLQEADKDGQTLHSSEKNKHIYWSNMVQFNIPNL